MTFQPTLPLGGVAGWQFLSRTLPTQKAAHAANTQLDRETQYFREKIGNITTAADLVADRTLLKVALGAFNLQDDLPNKYFIQKILEGGVLSTDSLANRMTDPRYAALSKAFGFGDYSVPSTGLSDFPDKIINAYIDRDFEVAVGDVDPTMRLALSLETELAQLVGRTKSDDARWFGVMGSGPLREVFETALGLPSSFGSLDIDKQLDVFRTRAKQVIGVGEVGDFTDPEVMDKLRTRFLIVAEATGSGGPTAMSPALSILSGGTSSSSILATLYGL